MPRPSRYRTHVRPTHRVIGTAGHIDHGKTSLVGALTGVQTDRLPEEKRRGITIVLGFAPLDLGEGLSTSIVDVPGHERFVKTMVAGASGIDLTLLVVAADEGVMPQTREHIEICRLLGLSTAVVALTKSDRVDPDMLELAREDVRSALEGSPFASAPIIPCSSKTGEGIEKLRATLRSALASVLSPPRPANTFLPLDRSFVVKGFGTVVTGTLLGGQLTPGQIVELMPLKMGHPVPTPIRARSVQVFGQDVPHASAGDRVAVSLTGVELDSTYPGQVIVKPDSVRPTRLLDVRLETLESRKKPTKSDSPVTLHVGTSAIPTRLTLLDRDSTQPGDTCFARLRLAEPVAVYPGQPFVIRGYESIARTLGGGAILDPDPPKRKRLHPATQSTLSALNERLASPASFQECVRQLVVESGVRGLDRASIARRLSLTDADISTSRVRCDLQELDGRLFSNTAVEGLRTRILSILEDHHASAEMKGGLPKVELLSRFPRSSRTCLTLAIQDLLSSNSVIEGADGLRLKGRADRTQTGGDARASIASKLESGGLEPPDIDSVVKETGLPEKTAKDLVSAMLRSGELIRSGSIFFGRTAHGAAREKVLEHLRVTGELSTADAKNLLGVSRKFLIPFLESLDKLGVTVRVGEVRKAKKP